VAELISGLRVARSFITPTGASVVSRELDFQLGARQGIEISSVLGYGGLVDTSPAASDTVPATERGSQSLHMETGTLESFPMTTGADEDDIDTEIFYAQMYTLMFQVPATAGGGGGIQHRDTQRSRGVRGAYPDCQEHHAPGRNARSGRGARRRRVDLLPLHPVQQR